jgi:hypothetical protein
LLTNLAFVDIVGIVVVVAHVGATANDDDVVGVASLADCTNVGF